MSKIWILSYSTKHKTHHLSGLTRILYVIMIIISSWMSKLQLKWILFLMWTSYLASCEIEHLLIINQELKWVNILSLLTVTTLLNLLNLSCLCSCMEVVNYILWADREVHGMRWNKSIVAMPGFLTYIYCHFLNSYVTPAISVCSCKLSLFLIFHQSKADIRVSLRISFFGFMALWHLCL